MPGKENNSHPDDQEQQQNGMDNVSESGTGVPDGERGGDDSSDNDHALPDTAGLDELKTLARERDDYLQRLRRAVADNLNLQNRMEKHRQRVEKEVLRALARKIVPLADSLARARETAEQTVGAEAICEGLRLTEKEFYQILRELRIEPIHAMGERFDPHFHDAVYQQPSSDEDPNTVVQVMKKGFLIDGELLRPSQVVVSARPQKSGGEEPDQEDTTDAG